MINKKNKNLIIAIAIIVVLSMAFALLYYLLSEEREENLSLFDQNKIEISLNGEVIKTIGCNDIISLGEEDFEATYNPSHATPVTKTYTGVPLKNILVFCDVNLNQINEVIVTANDNFTRAYGSAAISLDSEIYLAYKVNGEPFAKGFEKAGEGKENGGTYVTIIKSEDFSLNRCKCVIRINVITNND